MHGTSVDSDDGTVVEIDTVSASWDSGSAQAPPMPPSPSDYSPLIIAVIESSAASTSTNEEVVSSQAHRVDGMVADEELDDTIRFAATTAPSVDVFLAGRPSLGTVAASELPSSPFQEGRSHVERLSSNTLATELQGDSLVHSVGGICRPFESAPELSFPEISDSDGEIGEPSKEPL